MTAKFTTRLLVGAVAAIALAGCAVLPDSSPGGHGASSIRTTAYTAADFWGNYRMIAALEVNPAQSLDDLYERSELVVLGSVIDAEPGPSNPVRLADGSIDANGTTILTVRVDKVLAGYPAGQVKVWISNSNQSANDAPSAMMPADQLVWYLRPSEEPGIMYATARDGIIGSTAEGKLTTMLGLLGAELFPPTITSVDELADSVVALKEKSSG